MEDPQLWIDTYNVVRHSVADLADVAAQRVALMPRVGDVWSTTAHRLRDDGAVWMLADHAPQAEAYLKVLEFDSIFMPVLGAATLSDLLGFTSISDRLIAAGCTHAHTTQSVAAICEYVASPALVTWMAAAVATTAATWTPERDEELAAAEVASKVGEAMKTAAARIAIDPAPAREGVPAASATALAIGRIMGEPEDGLLLVKIGDALDAINARLEESA